MTPECIIGLVNQIRSATTITIGEGNVTNFVPCATNGIQQGNALRCTPPTPTASGCR